MACRHCITWFDEGHSVCPVCQGQRAAEAEERQQWDFAVEPTVKVRRLLDHGIYPVPTVTGASVYSRRGLTSKTPSRREVFRLTGDYFPEEVAAEMLVEISRHRWIEAEKAGWDIWRERDPENPQRAAAFDWVGRFFGAWREHTHTPLQTCLCSS